MIFMNISERYGDYAVVTLADYKELSPSGDFVETNDEIIEYFDDGSSEVVAELMQE